MGERCEGCGIEVAGGTAGCQLWFDELMARSWTPAVFSVHRLMVDAYSVQHPARYCRSGKSLAAHLGGLCCALEHAGDPRALDALRDWLDGDRKVDKPLLPDKRGTITIADVRAQAGDPAQLKRAVERWARSACEAYAPLHGTARQWVTAALSRR
jgi:hypothetical protein